MYVHPLYHWPSKARWVQKPSEQHTWAQFSAYVHFPFCRNICDFCGYETRLISKAAAHDFELLAIKQIFGHLEQDDFTAASLRSVFFGGGTASLLPERALQGIIDSIRRLAPFNDGAEITLECEPGTIGREKLKAAKAAGVNRVSVCAQAFDNAELKRLGRKHSHQQSLGLIDDCLAAGIENIHVDLMYGLPEQTLHQWQNTIEEVVRLPVQHVSAYKLYVFRHGALNRQNVAPRPEAESEAETAHYRAMCDMATNFFGNAGFQQYSLTEYARSKRESVYIQNCFDGNDLLPIGPSAFGRCGSQIWDNSPYVRMYGKPEAKRHDRALRLAPIETFKRDVILGLWLLRVSISGLAQRQRVTPGPRLMSLLTQLCFEGAIDFDGDNVMLLPHQRFDTGIVMERLAALAKNDWGFQSVEPSRATRDELATDRTTPRPELSTILRMARRDPTFYDALTLDPTKTLAKIDHGLSEEEILGLYDIILGETERNGRNCNIELQGIWKAVRAEHRNVAIIRQTDQP